MPNRTSLKQFWYKEGDSTAEVRNVLLVVAALIAAVTFQAGVNPPGSVWQENGGGNIAGRAILASHSTEYYVFLISNTLALSTSIVVIMAMTFRFPFHFEIVVATLAMLATYGSAVFAVSPHNTKSSPAPSPSPSPFEAAPPTSTGTLIENDGFKYALIVAIGPIVFRGVIEVYKKCVDSSPGHTRTANTRVNT